MEGPLVESPVFAPITLRDGTVATLHPMHEQDGVALVRFHHSLSTQTTYLRYFSVHPELSDAEVDRFTHVDHHDREAIVAMVGDDIVAVARYDRLPNGVEAEAAFVVADQWQGQGLGSALVARLVQRAREEGLARLVAETLPNNRRMLGAFRRAGVPTVTAFRDGVVHVALDLTAG